jgi:hypothetical protein
MYKVYIYILYMVPGSMLLYSPLRNGEGMGRAGKKGKGGKSKGVKDKGRKDMGGSCRFWHVKNARILLRTRIGRRFGCAHMECYKT